MVDPPIRRAVEQMFYVYILKSEKDNNLYIGFSKDLKSRVEAHNLGLNASTSYRRPLALLYYEGYTNEKDARIREKFLKTGRGHEVIYKQLENTLK
jgi:putative endonuclease